jgi:putative membrane protein
MGPVRCGLGTCGYGYGGHHGWGWLGFVDSLVFWLLVIAAVFVAVALLRRAGRGRTAAAAAAPMGGWASPSVPPHIAQAEATLADRFARGEISAEQYRDQLAVLRGYQPGYPAGHETGAQPPAAAPPEPPPPAAAGV